MPMLIIVLRAMHILGGIFWAGAAMLLYFFVVPSARATRPESGRFMQHLAGASGLSVWMQIASWATVIGGIGLFAPVTGGLEPAIMRTPRGIALSVGALLALGAFLEGLLLAGPLARKMAAIGSEMTASGKGPGAEQAQQLQAVQERLQRTGTRGAIMLAVAALLMSIARYL